MKSCDLLVVFQLALDLHNLLRQSASPPVVLPADHEFSKFHKPCEKIDAPPGWFDKIQRNIITLRSFYGKCYGIIIGRNLKSWKRFFGAWTQSSSHPVESETLVRHSRWRWKYTLSPQRASHWSCAWSPLASGLKHLFGAASSCESSWSDLSVKLYWQRISTRGLFSTFKQSGSILSHALNWGSYIKHFKSIDGIRLIFHIQSIYPINNCLTSFIQGTMLPLLAELQLRVSVLKSHLESHGLP